MRRRDAGATLRRAIAAFGPILTQVYGMTNRIVASLLTPEQHISTGPNRR